MRCSVCPGKYRCIGFNGPVNSPIRFIGEAPGWDEERKGECFIGKTGKEVNEHYLPLAGLRRPNVRIGNAIGCLPDTPQHKLKMDNEKHRELLATCASERLYPEMEQYPAQVTVPMGAFACYAIDPDIDLELHHGMPLDTKWGVVFPMYHPAGGIHEPKKMFIIRTDWYRLRQFLKGKLFVPVDQFAGQEDYKEVTSPEEVDRDLQGRWDDPIANDTEIKGRWHLRTPYCLSYSVVPGTGRLIKSDNHEALRQYQHHVQQWRGPILWHNWVFDERVTGNMGLTFPRRRIVDTMIKCFNLGNTPQGLKTLASRELGMEMLDFNDLVKGPSSKRCLEYLGDAVREDWPKPKPVESKNKDGTVKITQPHSMKTLMKIFFTYWKKDNNKDVFEAWDNWEDSHEMIQEKMGPWPGKCITHATEDDWPAVLRYACRDADALLRLWPRLQHMESRIRKRPQEQWSEAA